MLRSSPTPKGRCWHLARGAVPASLHDVAILADPEGPVLEADDDRQRRADDVVAILADPEGPVLVVRSPDS